jgi:hypothetical protein
MPLSTPEDYGDPGARMTLPPVKEDPPMNSDEAKARAEEAFKKIKEIAEAAGSAGRDQQGPGAKAKEMAAKSKSKAGDIGEARTARDRHRR